MPPKTLTHLDAEGAMHMVDVGDKEVTKRQAVAEAFVRLSRRALLQLSRGNAKKGDVEAAARLAGIQAAKRTWELIPLCHPLPLEHVAVELSRRKGGVRIEARAQTSGRTGVEMEALTAASVAALTLYDMLKAVDRGITIEVVRLLEKRGGKSGDFEAALPQRPKIRSSRLKRPASPRRGR